MTTRIGNLETNYSARGISSFQIELWHDGLKKHRLIKGADSSVVRRKAEMQADEWNSKWTEVQSKESDRATKESKKQNAVSLTEEAQKELERLNNILRHTLTIDDTIDWEKLKDTTPFPVPQPNKPVKPAMPQKKASRQAPEEPKMTQQKYQPKLGLLDKLLSSRREQREEECVKLFQSDLVAWKNELSQITKEQEAEEKRYEAEIQQYNATLETLKQTYLNNMQKWEKAKADFLEKQIISNSSIDQLHQDYLNGKPERVVEYCDMVLSASEYPDYFPKEFRFLAIPSG